MDLSQKKSGHKEVKFQQVIDIAKIVPRIFSKTAIYLLKIYCSHKTNPITTKILHTHSKVHHRTEEVNKSTSSGHNFFKSEHVEKTVLDSPYPIVRYLYNMFSVFCHSLTPKMLSKVQKHAIRGSPGQTQ